MSAPMPGAGPGAKRSVLFLCGHNAVRSPIAAALAAHYFGQSLEVASAGVRPSEPNPFAAAVMEEIGIDLTRHKPTTIEELLEYEERELDLVVSLSPEAHHRALELTRERPVEVEYWPIPDATAIWGNREQRLEAYRAVRDELLRRIKARFQT
jgi:protein-tyrosine-phosphatase